MLRRGERQAGQGAVWGDIRAKAARMHAASPTAAVHEMYTRHKATLEEYVAAFRPEARQCGGPPPFPLYWGGSVTC